MKDFKALATERYSVRKFDSRPVGAGEARYFVRSC